MVRISKQQERRSVSPRRPTISGKKTGSRKDNLMRGFKEHVNAAEGTRLFIPKVS